MKNNLKILILPGDGIGKEVMEVALPILDKFNLPIEFEFGEIGWECWKNTGNPIPQKTWEAIKKADAILLGAITSKPAREAENELTKDLKNKNYFYVSPVIQLRQKLDLYANVRPIFDVFGNNKFDLCVIRENTEGLYSGLDYRIIPDEIRTLLKQSQRDTDHDAACSIRLQTKPALEKIYRFAFEYATEKNLTRVTLADKPNVLRKSSQLAREVFEEIASYYKSISADILNVDAVGLWLVRRPEKFGVIVAENMFGDILSDVGGGVMGGLGFAPSANIGDNYAYFEPVHGSAPNIPSNKANPSAMFLTIKLLLEHLNYYEEAKRISIAVTKVLTQEKHLTYDVGGNATTTEMAKAIINLC